MDKLIIIDDHPMVREGLSNWIRENTSWQLEKRLASFEDVKVFLQDYVPNPKDTVIALVDLSFKKSNNSQELFYGYDIIPLLKEHGIKSIVYSSHETGSIIAHALDSQVGALGYVSKNADTSILKQALDSVARGKRFIQQDLVDSYIDINSIMGLLTRREKELIKHLCSKLTNEEIAQVMGISERSLANYFSRIYSKTGVENRLQLEEYFKYH